MDGFKEARSIFRTEEYVRRQEEIAQSNRLTLRKLAVAGLLLSVVNIPVQTLLSGPSQAVRSGLLLLYFVFLLILERFLLPRDFKNSTLVVYLIEAPAMVVGILLGTVWDTEHQAITILLLLIAMPVFILDRPQRLLAVFFAWTALFVGVSWMTKPAEIFTRDAYHALEFYLASIAVSFVVLSVRLDTLRSFARVRHHLEHDPLTGLRNNNYLDRQTDRYLNRPLAVMVGELEQLGLYSNFYGHAVGDEILVAFAEAMRGIFGHENSYRRGGGELMCIVPDVSEAEALRSAELCRENLKNRNFGDKSITLTVAYGVVLGTPETAEDLHNMIRLADLFSHKARRQGRGQTISGPFDPKVLEAGIRESRAAARAGLNEISALTDLPSLSYFAARADELLSTADTSRHPMVGYIKVLHFRNYNDKFGYAEGDELIRYTAGALRTSFAGLQFCYITGGKFGVLCYRAEVEEALERLRTALRDYRPGYPMYLQAGFAEYTTGDSAISLLDKAREAYRSIRYHEQQPLRYYDAALDEESRFRQYILTHVDEAVGNGWLRVFYQPIARSVTGLVCNEEALVRWEDPRYGFLTPDRFIPILEENRLIHRVSLFMVEQILKDTRRRRELNVPVTPVSVNLSRHDLEQCDMVQEINRLMAASGLPRRLLNIEITESTFMEDQTLLKREIDRFRGEGYEVWIDDFGSEYSTLNLLQELDVDLIKLDMQFMANFSANSKNAIIISNLVDMAHRLGITTLVEGIETQEQFEILRDMGCEKIQGFLYNKPTPLDVIVHRNKTGIGLKFEDQAETAYYSAIGRIDLNLPFSRGGPSVQAETAVEQLACGVMELSGGGFHCIRGTRAFYRVLSELRLLPEDTDPGTRRATLRGALPAQLPAAAKRCQAGSGWQTIQVATPAGLPYILHLRRVADDPVTGATALLTVLLRETEQHSIAP